MVNDPYVAGTHLNDVTLFGPVYAGGVLVGWVAVKAHHVDVGGRVPGSIGGASSLWDEGVVVGVRRVVEGGRVDEGFLEWFASQTREPLTVLADLYAQLAALGRARGLVAGLAERRGVELFLGALGESIAYVERYVRERVASAIRGAASAVDYVEGSLGLYRVAVRVSGGPGGRVVVDFAGSSPEAGEPLNTTLHGAAAAAAFALKAWLDPEMPVNDGFYRVVEVRAPGGTIVNPRRGAPVSAYTETVQRVVDAVQAALARLLPGRVGAASCGTMSNVALGGRGWAFYETIACGQGALPGADGASAVHVNMTNTLNTPVEVLEQRYPVRVLEYRVRRGSGGVGRWRGGDGVRRALMVLDEAVLSVAVNRVATRPWGLMGGCPGEPARVVVRRRDGGEELLPPLASRRLGPGDVVVVETPGGGGYGEPPGGGGGCGGGGGGG